ncbi:MAG: hypothetical protein IJI24_00020 [Lachnospiraceae bacterium]|nr:hypothetical protein [Lachnospiraceae bacterium]
MAINPMQLMKLGERYSLFQTQHPLFASFLNQAAARAIKEGSVIEVKVTDPEGKEMVTNLKITPEDMETIEIFKSMK